MTKEVMTANKAVAEAVRLAKPQVIPVYPITPQTTISEYLAQYVADERINAKYVKVESEHSAISAAVGASGAGVRVFTATSSQGLMLMHEILFAAAGMRTPIVLADANRAISAPLNIWNDQQDSIAQRDSGWLQIYVENAQEALDTTLMAYKISENPKVLLPSMVCLDGFILTHTVEPVEIPDEKAVDEFLPPYKPKHSYLDPNEPMSVGTLADPDYYLEARYDIQVAMDNSLEVIQETCDEFAEKFGRKYGLIETYKTEDAEIIFVAMGSICSTLRIMVDQLRKQGEKVGLLKVRTYRPFPAETINEAVKNCDKLAVLDKNVTFGIGGALYTDIKSKIHKDAYGFIVGLGGRDITPDTILEIYEKAKNPEKEVSWIGLKEE
ncbi:pyruvate synthase subunit PorA [Methanobrevibacter oralis]|uniref:Pyruvate synthase subunit PorA n=1 Tax=Methanobrevibacter oralis TaxID=66851 RepID=A0A162FKQ3_METOA|nr:pyruvate synthase subunit PorA [Methanobrevibacter oralis]KZX11470.1 pyruvate synthase subunit PorA [Methanobrevibacter oralis]